MRWSLKHGDSECYKWSRRQTNCLIIAYDVFFSSLGSKREQILRCKDLIIVLCHYCSYISWIIVKTAASSKNYFPLQDIKASSLGTKEKKKLRRAKCLHSKKKLFYNNQTSGFNPVRFHLLWDFETAVSLHKRMTSDFFCLFRHFSLFNELSYSHRFRGKNKSKFYLGSLMISLVRIFLLDCLMVVEWD